MEEVLALIGRAHQGDKRAREILVETNTGLVWSIVRRFQNRGVDMEDLFQIGSIGLIKAIDHFDVSYDVKFSTYAVPMITGEIKRFLRDDGMIKVSRGLKETAVKAYRAREQLEKKKGMEPSLEEISAEIGLSPEEVVMAMESCDHVESLSKTIYSGEGNAIYLEDLLPDHRDHGQAMLDRMLLTDLIGQLDGRERELIFLRYFEEQTQTAVAKALDMTQVQVSREEKKILKKLRTYAKGIK